MISSYLDFVNEGIFDNVKKKIEKRKKGTLEALAILRKVKQDFKSYPDLRKISLLRRGSRLVSLKYNFGDDITENARYGYLEINQHWQLTMTIREVGHYEKLVYIDSIILQLFYSYFKNLYLKKYPQLKHSDYLTRENIQRIEKTGRLVLKTLPLESRNGRGELVSVYDLKDIKKLKEYFENIDIVDGISSDGKKTHTYTKLKSKSDIKEFDPYGEEDWEDDPAHEFMRNNTYEDIFWHNRKIIEDICKK